MLTNSKANRALQNLFELISVPTGTAATTWYGHDLYLGLGLANKSKVSDSTIDSSCTPDDDGNNFIEPSIFTSFLFHNSSTTCSGTLSVDIDKFKTKISSVGTYVFTYSSSGWSLSDVSVSLTDYGISISGTPASGNTITIELYKELPYTRYCRSKLIEHQLDSSGKITTTLKEKRIDNPSDGIVKNSEEIQFEEAQEVWGNIIYFGLFTSETGGTPVMWGRLTTDQGVELTSPTLVGPTLVAEGGTGITVTATATGSLTASIVPRTFRNKLALEFREQTYYFTFNGTSWTYGGAEVSLSDYGITVTGSPVIDSQVTVAVSITGSVVVFRSNKFHITLDPVTNNTCTLNTSLKNRIMNLLFGFKEDYLDRVSNDSVLYIGLGLNGYAPILSNGIFTNFKEPTGGTSASTTFTQSETYAESPTDTANQKSVSSFPITIPSLTDDPELVTGLTVSGSITYSYLYATNRVSKTITINASYNSVTCHYDESKCTVDLSSYISDSSPMIMACNLSCTLNYIYNVAYKRRWLVKHVTESNILSPISDMLNPPVDGVTYNNKNLQFKEASTDWGDVMYFGIFETPVDTPDESGYTHPVVCGKLTDGSGTEISTPVSLDGSVNPKVALFRDHHFKFALDREVSGN